MPELKNFTTAKQDWKSCKALVNDQETIYDNPLPLFPPRFPPLEPKAIGQVRMAPELKVAMAIEQIRINPYMTEAARIKDRVARNNEVEYTLDADQLTAVADLYEVG